VLCIPRAGSVPLQPPDAVQAVALVELQLNVAAPPLGTTVGDALNVAEGTTLTVMLDGTLLPPWPLQLNEYVAEAANAPVLCVPLAGLVPLQAPDAVQAVALVERHPSVVEAPTATAAAPADNVAVGAGITVMVASEVALVPPAPVQTNE